MPCGRARRGQRGDYRQLGQRCVTVGLVAAISALLLSTGTADVAYAGTYVMRNCSVPGYASAPSGPWQANAASNLAVADACATGDGIAFGFVGVRESAPGYLAKLGFDMSSASRQRAIRLEKVTLWYAARLRGSGQAINIVSMVGSPDGTVEGGEIMGPPGSENLGFEQQFRSAANVAYSVFLVCGPANYPDRTSETCVADHETPLQVRGMAVTLSEDLLPAATSPAGTLLSGGPQHGVRTVSYAASDPQSGLAKVEVLLGDTVVKSHDLTPRCFYSDFTVCPASDDGTLEIDTRTVPNGAYDLTLRVTDAAGNQQVVRGERVVEVANEGPAQAPNALRYAITASFKGTSRSTLTVPYGRRVSLRGRLTQGSGAAAAGIPIEVRERADRRGARERSTRTVTTKPDGSFAIGVATSRPSRVIRLAYRPAGGAQVVSRALTLRVIGASRVKASLRGRIVRFSGRVLGAPFPKGGKRVQMEGRSPGSAWTPFQNLRTDSKGRFSGTYRLRVQRPGVVLKVRAVVPREAGYGYLASRSRAVTLRVR